MIKGNDVRGDMVGEKKNVERMEQEVLEWFVGRKAYLEQSLLMNGMNMYIVQPLQIWPVLWWKGQR